MHRCLGRSRRGKPLELQRHRGPAPCSAHSWVYVISRPAHRRQCRWRRDTSEVWFPHRAGADDEAASSAPDGGDPFQHRALVGFGRWRGSAASVPSDMKVELGGRMTYDVTHGGFAAQLAKPAAGAGSRPSAISKNDTYTEAKPFSRAAVRAGFRDARPVPAGQRVGIRWFTTHRGGGQSAPLN